MSNRIYDTVKLCVTIILPAMGTLYFALAGVWGLPYPEAVVATVTAVCTFLGTCMGISSHAYHNSSDRFAGEINIDTTNPEKDVFSLDLNGSPLEIASKDHVTFKVNSDTR